MLRPTQLLTKPGLRSNIWGAGIGPSGDGSARVPFPAPAPANTHPGTTVMVQADGSLPQVGTQDRVSGSPSLILSLSTIYTSQINELRELSIYVCLTPRPHYRTHSCPPHGPCGPLSQNLHCLLSFWGYRLGKIPCPPPSVVPHFAWPQQRTPTGSAHLFHPGHTVPGKSGKTLVQSAGTRSQAAVLLLGRLRDLKAV